MLPYSVPVNPRSCRKQGCPLCLCVQSALCAKSALCAQSALYAQSAFCADSDRQSALRSRLCILPGGCGRGCIQDKGQVIPLPMAESPAGGPVTVPIWTMCCVFQQKRRRISTIFLKKNISFFVYYVNPQFLSARLSRVFVPGYIINDNREQ